jgi:hypothetical protein
MFPIAINKGFGTRIFPGRPTLPKSITEEDVRALYVPQLWLGAHFSAGEPFLPPSREMPTPDEDDEEEIDPKPAIPEEEEYLPDEEEIIEHPKRETDNPYQPGPKEGFPTEKKPEFPAIGPAR